MTLTFWRYSERVAPRPHDGDAPLRARLWQQCEQMLALRAAAAGNASQPRSAAAPLRRRPSHGRERTMQLLEPTEAQGDTTVIIEVAEEPPADEDEADQQQQSQGIGSIGSAAINML